MRLHSTSMILAALIASSNLFSVATWEAFVVRSIDALTPISVPSDVVGSNIPISGETSLYAAAITPDGNRILVTTGTANVAVLDLTQSPLEPAYVSVGSDTFDVAITPDGRWALVTESSNNSVGVLDLSQSPVLLEKTISVGRSPQRVAITPDGTRALVTNHDSDSVSVLTIGASVEFGYNISVGTHPADIGISPDGMRALVSLQESNEIAVLDLSLPSISVSYTIPAGGSPNSLAISPDGKLAIVTCGSTVSVLDMTKSTITQGYIVHTGQSGANGIAFTPDATRAYIANSDSTVSVFDTTQAPIAPISTIGIDHSAQGITITPDQAPTSSFIVSADKLTVSCDAAASSSPVGGIKEYLWDFGDRTDPVSTTSPTLAHTYDKSGTYTITLTVINDGGTSTEVTFTGKTMSNHGLPRAQSVQTITLDPQAPAAFTGKARLSGNGNELSLKVRWPSSTDMNTLKYEIFARGKKIAEFFPTIHNHAAIKLNPHHIPDRISPDYKLYLHHKYGIRSMNTEGLVSPIVWLEVE